MFTGWVLIFQVKKLKKYMEISENLKNVELVFRFKMYTDISEQHWWLHMLFYDLIQGIVDVKVSKGNKTTCIWLWSPSIQSSFISLSPSWMLTRIKSFCISISLSRFVSRHKKVLFVCLYYSVLAIDCI